MSENEINPDPTAQSVEAPAATVAPEDLAELSDRLHPEDFAIVKERSKEEWHDAKRRLAEHQLRGDFASAEVVKGQIEELERKING